LAKFGGHATEGAFIAREKRDKRGVKWGPQSNRKSSTGPSGGERYKRTGTCRPNGWKELSPEGGEFWVGHRKTAIQGKKQHERPKGDTQKGVGKKSPKRKKATERLQRFY